MPGSSPVRSPWWARVGRDLFGRRCIGYVCACGFQTFWWLEDDETEAAGQVAEHVADKHPEWGRVGRCAECQQPTDHFHADSELGRLWLCEAHAPVMPPAELGYQVPVSDDKLRNEGVTG